MRRISEMDMGRLARMSQRPSDDSEFIYGRDGFPIDRTLCPWCVGGDADCASCGGTGVVCPKCRGARVLRDAEADRPQYHGCPDCTDWLDSNRQWGGSGNAHNWPNVSRVVDRELSAVAYYRRSKRDADMAAARARKD